MAGKQEEVSEMRNELARMERMKFELSFLRACVADENMILASTLGLPE